MPSAVRNPLFWLACLALLWFGFDAPQRVQARPPVLPQAMIDACKGLKEDAPCQFALSGKQVSGSCAPLPDAELACRPGPGARSKKPKAAPPAP